MIVEMLDARIIKGIEGSKIQSPETEKNRRDDDVIIGSGNNFDICASDHQRRRFDPKYKECIGVFV